MKPPHSTHCSHFLPSQDLPGMKPPFFPGPCGPPHSTHCSHFLPSQDLPGMKPPHSTHCSHFLPSQDLPGMKPPFFPGNEVSPFGLCAVGQPFKSSVVVPHPGWEWVDEGKLSAFSKWGFVSTQVGREGRRIWRGGEGRGGERRGGEWRGAVNCSAPLNVE